MMEKLPANTTDTTGTTVITGTTDYSVAICGAGPVGLALALLLVRHGMAPQRIALLDAKTLAQSVQDPRSIAISYGSRLLLQEIGAWTLPVTPIHQIHISRRGRFGRTLIDRADLQVPALGYVARYGDLVAALAAQVNAAGIRTLRPARIQQVTPGSDQVQLHWQRQQEAAPHQASADIAVQAEGALLFGQAGQPLIRNYEQTAITALVQVSAPIAGRAFERFTDEGPLALLPQDDGYALVWCVRPATASMLLNLPDADFLEALERTFGSRMGRFLTVTRRHAFALGLHVRPAASGRIVTIGNAAQTLHPVAGQGFNLGLRDAAVLARLLGQDASAATLQRFVQTRQPDRRLIIGLTDSMARLFTSNAADGNSLQTLLGGALYLLDTLSPAKRMLTEIMIYGRR